MKSLWNLLSFCCPATICKISLCIITNGFVPSFEPTILTSSINLLYGSLQVATSMTVLPLLVEWFPSILDLNYMQFILFLTSSLEHLWFLNLHFLAFPPLKLSHWALFHCPHCGLMSLYLLDFHKQNLENFFDIP